MDLVNLTTKVENQDKTKSLIWLAQELIKANQVNEKSPLQLTYYLSDIRIKLGLEPTRIIDNCAYYSEKDIEKILEHLKKKGYLPPKDTRF